jgi:hypothetical protein
LKRLPEVLLDGERLVNVDRAECADQNGLLAVTDARFVFLRTKLLGTEVDTYPYDQLRAVQATAQLFGGHKVVLQTETGAVEFRKLEDVRAQRIVEYVQSRLRGEVNVPVPAQRNLGDLKRQLGWLNRAVLFVALGRLTDVLAAGESIGPGSYCTHDGVGGLVLATDRRLLFVPNGASKPPEDWPYTQIGGIELEDSTTIHIQARGSQDSLRAVDAGRGEPIVHHVRARVERASKSQPLLVPLKPDPPREKPPPRAQHPTPVDLNTATADEMHDRLGLDGETAARAIELRNAKQGRFASVADFADSLSLPPHLHAAVQRLAVVVQPPASSEAPRPPGDIDIG